MKHLITLLQFHFHIGWIKTISKAFKDLKMFQKPSGICIKLQGTLEDFGKLERLLQVSESYKSYKTLKNQFQ